MGVLSPPIMFLVYTDITMLEVMECAEIVMNVGGLMIRDVILTDDQV